MLYCITAPFHSQAEGTEEDKGETGYKETKRAYQIANIAFNRISLYVANCINQRSTKTSELYLPTANLTL
jgi:hypothetical protein